MPKDTGSCLLFLEKRDDVLTTHFQIPLLPITMLAQVLVVADTKDQQVLAGDEEVVLAEEVAAVVAACLHRNQFSNNPCNNQQWEVANRKVAVVQEGLLAEEVLPKEEVAEVPLREVAAVAPRVVDVVVPLREEAAEVPLREAVAVVLKEAAEEVLLAPVVPLVVFPLRNPNKPPSPV